MPNPTGYAANVSRNVKTRALVLRISVDEVAAAIGVKRVQASARLNGRMEFRLSELEALAGLLRTSPAALADPGPEFTV